MTRDVNNAHRTAALLLILAVVTFLSGCAGRVDGPVPAPTAPAASSQPHTEPAAEVNASRPSDTGETAPRGSSGGLSARELARIRAQLDAMRNEIDDLQMPSDDDFDGAASDLY